MSAISRCDVCLGDEGPVFSSPNLPNLLQKHLGIQTENVSSCEACSQLLNLWDEFSHEARVNLGNDIVPDNAQASGLHSSLLHTDMECQTENVNSEETLNFTRHFQGICDMCNTTFINIQSFHDHLNCVHSEHNFILFTNKHIIEDSKENKYNIVEIKKRSMYKNPYNCIYICNNCNKTFVSKQLLASHINDDHSKTSYMNNLLKKSCDICELDLSLQDNMFDHLMNQHIQNNDSKYECPFCKNLFDSHVDIEFHLETCYFNIQSKLQCNLPCNMIVSSKPKLDKHVKMVHRLDKKGYYVCNDCKKTFTQKHNLRNHIISQHINCKIQITIPNTHDSTVNEETVTTEKKNECLSSNACCNYCKKSFSSVAKLNMHIKTMHPQLQMKNLRVLLDYSCSLCQKCFSSNSELISHVADTHKETANLNILKRSNTEDITKKNNNIKKLKKGKVDLCDNFDYLVEDGVYCCNYCHKSSNLEWAVKLHLKNFHQIYFPKIKSDCSNVEHESEISNVPLESCISSTSNTQPESSTVNDGSNQVPITPSSSTGLQDYSCKFCTMISVNDHEFIEHLKGHVREKIKFSSGKAAVESSPTPVKIIEDKIIENLIPCNKCNEKFMNMDELKTHISKTHKKVAEYTCTICFKSFTTSLGLTVHNQVHENKVLPSPSTASLNFICDICGKELASKHGYVLHKKYAHPNHQTTVKTEGESSNIPSLHENKHTQNKSSVFVCKFCDQRLENEFEFTQHLMDHVKRI